MQTNTTRDKTIDFIKGILILFVILGHTTLGLTDMYSFDDTMNGIANVIYSFHMPCFIAVSGFLYSEYVGDASQGIFSRIGHKAFNILLPYVMISVIYWIIEYSCAITPQVRQAGNRLCEFTRVMFCLIHRLHALRCHVRHQCL